MAIPLKRLPLDLSTFRILRNQGYLYVDKTRCAYGLITGGRRFFLSRPRRFGKSLFVSMLHEILRGNRELFNDLWIAASDYGWHKHGVITLDLSLLSAKTDDTFEQSLCYALTQIAISYDIDISPTNTIPEIQLSIVAQALYKKFGRVAVLIDEYDSPILKKLHTQDEAIAIRDSIRSFFTALKGLDAYIDFVFIAGVSSFAKAGIFSGMNNLQNITMHETFADICGYTEGELDLYFNNHIRSWAEQDGVPYQELRHKIRTWYNGYRFTAEAQARVYNPFSLMNALEHRKLSNFWISSGTPTFLIEELKKQQQNNPRDFAAIIHPASFHLSQNTLGTFDVGLTPLPVLMFQAGYLTIASHNRDNDSYQLGYPNHEVERACHMYWLSIATRLETTNTESLSFKLNSALKRQDIGSIIDIIKALFAHLTYQIMPKTEREYHLLLQAMFALTNARSHAEYATQQGRADIIVELDTITYVIELKIDTPPEVALKQIKDRKYYERFLKKGHEVLLLGISFTRTQHQLDIDYKLESVLHQ